MTTEDIALLGESGEFDDPPAVPGLFSLIEDPACEIISVPVGLNDNHECSGTESSGRHRLPPLPLFLPKRRTSCLFVVLDRVVDDQEVRPFTCNRSSNPRGSHPAFSAFKVPAIGGTRSSTHANTEQIAVEFQ